MKSAAAVRAESSSCGGVVQSGLFPVRCGNFPEQIEPIVSICGPVHETDGVATDRLTSTAPQALHIELIINTSNVESIERLRESVTLLRGRDHHVYPRITFEAGDATRFAREATTRGADLVICAGGDGTVNEVVNGILPPFGSPLPRGLPRLGIIPLGTGNDFAAFNQIPLDLDEAIAVAVDGPETSVDIGVLNRRYFANVSSGGLGAQATEETSDRSKRLLGAAAYLVTGARTFAALEPSRGRFSSRGEMVFEGSFLFFAVGNGGRAGGGTWITPRASLTDGLLDLCVIPELSRTELLRLLPEVRSGDHLDNDRVIYRRMDRLTIEPIGEISVNMDGEPLTAPLLEYSVLPHALRLARPDAG